MEEFAAEKIDYEHNRIELEFAPRPSVSEEIQMQKIIIIPESSLAPAADRMTPGNIILRDISTKMGLLLSGSTTSSSG